VVRALGNGGFGEFFCHFRLLGAYMADFVCMYGCGGFHALL
jgi:hypothetical protein